MDGRRARYLAGALLAGAVGCNTAPKKYSDATVQKPTMPATSQVATNVPPPPAEPPRTNLKPSTYVAMGALTEQAANEPDRPPAERENFRQQARQTYQKAIDVDPKCTAAYVALGESYLANGERDKAQAMFQKATDIAPNDAGLWSELGAAQARAKDWPAAIGSLNRAVQIDPGNKALETRLGLTLARAGRYEDALNSLAKVMPEAEARYNVARMMRHNNDTVAADTQLQLALKADPTFEAAREMLGGQASASPVQQAGYQQATARPAAAPPAASPQMAPVHFGGSQ
jgi:tetratricopeptide (TPR) repeat protein